MSLTWPESFLVEGPFHAANALGHVDLLNAGVLDVPSGKLALGNFGADGCNDPEFVPVVEVPPGPYEATVSWLRWDPPMAGLPNGDVAAVHLARVGGHVERWEFHRRADGEPFRLMVDHGIAGLFDLGTAPRAAVIADEVDVNLRELARLWEYQDTPWFLWIDSILAFRCGGGDGAYKVWLGYDTNDIVNGFFLELGMVFLPRELLA